MVLELNLWAQDNLANCASIDDDTCSRHSSVNSDASTVILEDSHIENMQSAKDCFSLAVRRNPGDGELRALAEFAANNSGIINRINNILCYFAVIDNCIIFFAFHLLCDILDDRIVDDLVAGGRQAGGDAASHFVYLYMYVSGSSNLLPFLLCKCKFQDKIAKGM